MEKGGKPFRSKLVPYLETIRSMRKGGSSYAEIAEALKRGNGIEVERTTIYSFVKARSKIRKVRYAIVDGNGEPVKEAGAGKEENVFSALRRAAKANVEAREKKSSGFNFDETQPLR